jgi:hypothetical protein
LTPTSGSSKSKTRPVAIFLAMRSRRSKLIRRI